jgi:hypothetical protein
MQADEEAASKGHNASSLWLDAVKSVQPRACFGIREANILRAQLEDRSIPHVRFILEKRIFIPVNTYSSNMKIYAKNLEKASVKSAVRLIFLLQKKQILRLYQVGNT